MCTQFETGAPLDLDRAYKGQLGLDIEYPREIFRDYPAPFIRRAGTGQAGDREAVLGRFRLIPFRAADPAKFAANTMNARTETVGELWSFKGAWQRRQTCIIPAWGFYEPYYETPASKSVRWRIAAADGQMLAIAGIWDHWHKPGQADILSFAMLTINCDNHPLLKRFHKWFDAEGKPEEKRTPVLLEHTDIDAWLSCSVEEAPSFFKTFSEQDLVAMPAPVVRRKPAKAAADGDQQAL